MATKLRYQNPVIGDTVRLELFVYNSNNLAALDSITDVKIYYLDPAARSEPNPDGRTLVETVPGGSVTTVSDGEYYLDLVLDPGTYTETGRYLDIWNVTFDGSNPAADLEHLFEVYPDLWYTTPIPVVYDFSFFFQPNKFRLGTKKYIEIEIVPNVPRATDLEAYYVNLATAATLTVTVTQHCGDCATCDPIVEDGAVQYREKNRAFWFVDTEEFGEGIFDITFKLEFGGNVYLSEVNQISIYS